MTTPSHRPSPADLFEVPLDQGHDGDILPPEDTFSYLHPKAADHILRTDHPYYTAQTEASDLTEPQTEDRHNFRSKLEEEYSGYPSMELSTWVYTLLETLDSLALALKASGRAINRYDQNRIARSMGISAGEVNDHGVAMQPEHEERANKAFSRLMMRGVLVEAGLDVSDPERIEALRGKYFGSAKARNDNAKLRRRLDKIKNQTSNKAA